jgi:hypothetical protein
MVTFLILFGFFMVSYILILNWLDLIM